MRKDIGKVITERPRVGGDGGKSIDPKGYKKRQQKLERKEELPSFESNAPGRRYGYDHKQFSERLGPLRKFLRSRVGCAWNEVFSEICANLRVDSAVQSHVRDHVKWEVETDVEQIIQDMPYDVRGNEVYKDFYVDPNTGILCYQERKRYRWKENERPKKFVEGKDENHQYHCMKGIWYEVELAPIPPKVKTEYGWSASYVYDVMLKSSFRIDCERQYGKSVYAIDKRQLNSKEIKRLKLWETPQGIAARNEAA